ncbi:MAG: hypothetical protein LAT68_14240 [Cyclobacteriaceae bacterium]|nr:hypothetical protein [Cyclobacteriaceae bacterium]
MMGTRQELKHGDEWDVVYARHVYCYLRNRPSTVRDAKRRLRRRRRHEARKELRCVGQD